MLQKKMCPDLTLPVKIKSWHSQIITEAYMTSKINKTSLFINSKSFTIILERKLRDRWMRAYLINKNLCFYYRLRKRIGKKSALGLAKAIEKIILLF